MRNTASAITTGARRALLRKRSLTLAGHRTSVALEPQFWAALERRARERRVPLARFVSDIDAGKSGGLASALRVFVLETAPDHRPAAGREKNGPFGSSPKRPKSGEKP